METFQLDEKYAKYMVYNAYNMLNVIYELLKRRLQNVFKIVRVLLWRRSYLFINDILITTGIKSIYVFKIF